MKTAIAMDSKVRRHGEVLARPLDDDLVMANLESGHYYGLARTGKRIWELLAQPVAVADMCATLIREFEVDATTCEREVLDFLNDLQNNGLVLLVD